MADETVKKEPVITSGVFAVDWRDAGKGLIMAAISAGIGAAYGMLHAHQFGFDNATLQETAKAAMGGGLAYLTQKFFSPKKIIMPVDQDEPPVNWPEKINECYTIEEITAIHPSVPPEFEGVWQARFLSISNGTAGTPKGGTK